MMKVFAALAMAALTCLAPAAAQTPMKQTPLKKVTIGGTLSATDIGLWVAHKKGYFRDEGIDAEFITFDSAARMIAALGTGDLDVSAGGHSAGLFNAVARGIDIRIVADKSQNVTGRGSQKLLVRKEHIDSGRYKSFADLKGMKIAGSAPGSAASTVILKFLEKGGLKASDIDNVYMSFPQMGVALQNGAVDAALPAEPAVSAALRLGGIVAVANDYDVYPVHQISEILYAGKFATGKPEVARKFMRAFLRGVRAHNDALGPDGAFVGEKGDEIVSILTEYGSFKDPKVWRSFVFSSCGPDGTLHVPSMKEDLAIWREQGLIETPIEIEKALDMSFVEWAVKDLGPYVKK
jgi:NitT/TauT family transport system substrate-binding protein